MTFENQILDALMIVSAWDIPDEDFADAVNDQARLMAGVNPCERWEDHSEIH
jgi:hypothetical protein